MGSLIVIKVLISMAFVGGLAEISKRINPVFGGILAGVPITVALSIYFIAYEQGMDFMVDGLPWGIAGLGSALLFFLGYFMADKLIRTSFRPLSILISSFAGLLLFGSSGWLFHSLKLGMISSLAVFLLVFTVNLYVMRRYFHSEQIKRKYADQAWKTIIRGFVAGLIILAITMMAATVGSKWAGLLSAFPAVTFCLILILHYEHGSSLYPGVVYGFSHSVTTLVVFYTLCRLIMPHYDLNTSFMIIYPISLLYLFGLQRGKAVFAKMKIKEAKLS